MSIAVVDYDAGNLRSVETALSYLAAGYRVIQDPEELNSSDRLVVPGVGDARAAMETLESRGFVGAIRAFADSGRPVLGICLGSQIILDRSEENDAVCLGLIRGRAVALPSDRGLKVPHMGWNTIIPTGAHPLLHGVARDDSFYFVHSYVPHPEEKEDVLAECDYEGLFAAVIGRDNVVATQFHPEKSGPVGLRMLQNFLHWDPK